MDGSRAKSSAMIDAAPRRKANGEEAMRPMRTGISLPIRPSFVAITWCTGSIRSSGGSHVPSDERFARCRSARPRA